MSDGHEPGDVSDRLARARADAGVRPPAGPRRPPPTEARALPDEVRAAKADPRRRLGPSIVLLEELGRGGMGVVERGFDLDLHRPIAVKRIVGLLPTDRDRERLRRETTAIAALEHPGIVRLHYVGDAEGQPFAVMELVVGRDLEKLVADERPTPRRAAEILVALARAVHHAHEHGVVHRDLKPSNVMIDANAAPRLLDFGLAKTHEIDRKLTRTGQLIGTPSYMAPEQAGLSADELDARADVYGLGGVLYFLLTGKAPFTGASIVEVVRKVLVMPANDPCVSNPRVPRELGTIALRCLEKRPDERYQSASEVAEDLERWLGRRPIQARRPGPLQRTHRWARDRVPALALAAAVAVIGGIVIAAISWGRSASIQSARREAIEGSLERAAHLIEPGAETPPDDLFAARLAIDEAMVRLIDSVLLSLDGGSVTRRGRAILARCKTPAELETALHRKGWSLPRDAAGLAAAIDASLDEHERVRSAVREGLWSDVERGLSKHRVLLDELARRERDPRLDPSQTERELDERADSIRAILATITRLDPSDRRAETLVGELEDRGTHVTIALANADDAAEARVVVFEPDDEGRVHLASEGALIDPSEPVELPPRGVIEVRRPGFVPARAGFSIPSGTKRHRITIPPLVPVTGGREGMTLVVGGPFVTGGDAWNSESRMPRAIELPAFLIDVDEVTRGEFARFVEVGGYRDRSLWTDEGWRFRTRGALEQPKAPHEVEATPGEPSLPIVGVSLFEAEAYARWVGKRLPTAHEWEKAARGVDGRSFPWGNRVDPSFLHEFAPKQGCAVVGSHPRDESPFGMRDAAGNVMEWTSTAARTGRSDGSIEQRRNVAKGSAWAFDPTHAVRAHTAARAAFFKTAREPFLGFRCAADLPK